MDKPKMKREVVIRDILPISKALYLFASKDALQDFEEFGTIQPLLSLGDNCYMLTIDPRFDFDEVIAYIEAY